MKKITIGQREIVKAIKTGELRKVLVAKNCPSFLLDKLKNLDVEIKQFEGNQRDLGTHLGKPFPVAMAGYED